ncbi:RNA 2',3'-cyclic phosphodiesterase [Pontibacter sp. 172403-2]|uniref:RNA 2',3'-cyclic phosphodiesterase n=1 Tax=Pontibacter rufus TaxID=2791028 RepID=UPI0018AF7D59|nr:RNA 2',3'-cyclic phosphodiesterase [Pontibacter sp. 172403-2]MBF9253946.1 RNA 2',3'-cyclic phosphodiesterase [Pontibacter sp. 172403-2]
MKNDIRLFVAASLPASLKAQLQQLLLPFEHPDIRFLPGQNLHLTLYFMGNVPLAQLPGIQQQIRQAAQQEPPFTLDFDCVETGPKPKSPRLVWARFKPSLPFEQLSRQLTQAFSPVPVREQKVIPHVTLARFRKNAPKPTGLPPVYASQPLQLTVDSVALWQSELASPHPVYTVLENYPLGQNL